VPEKDILRDLRANEADRAELEQVLLSHYGWGSATDDGIAYARKGEEIGLRVCYDNSWEIAALLTGPGFTNTDEEILRRRILDQLLTKGPERIGRKVLFADVPTKGWFRYKDWIQLGSGLTI
jgi:putative component of toxin-antitoxin plasmid stabilization module